MDRRYRIEEAVYSPFLKEQSTVYGYGRFPTPPFPEATATIFLTSCSRQPDHLQVLLIGLGLTVISVTTASGPRSSLIPWLPSFYGRQKRSSAFQAQAGGISILSRFNPVTIPRVTISFPFPGDTFFKALILVVWNMTYIYYLRKEWHYCQIFLSPYSY